MSRRDRVLVLHQYPPTPCLYTFEKGLRENGHDVVSVGPSGTYGDATQFRQIEPDCAYLPAEPTETLASILNRIGDPPDWVFYLRPSQAFLPPDLAECPVPLVGWLEDEFKFADVDQHLVYNYDLAPTAYAEISELYSARGLDNRPCVNYFTASWLMPDGEIDFADRPIDVSFIGHLDPGQTRLRCRELEQVMRLRKDGVKVYVREGLYLRQMMDVYARSKFVFQHSGQGAPNLTYRVGEAMTCGAVLLSKRPNRAEGLPSPLVEGEHVLYYDDFDHARELVRHYLDHEDERRAIAENGYRYVREQHPWGDPVQAFVEQHVWTLPADYRERRRERLARFGVNDRRRRIDHARSFLIHGNRPDLAKASLEAVPDWQGDTSVLTQHALMSLFAGDAATFERDMNAVLSARPDHPLATFNRAVLFYQQRGAVGLDAARQAASLESAERATLSAEDVEGLYFPPQMRFRMEVSRVYLDHPSGSGRIGALLDLFVYQLRKNLGVIFYESQQFEDAVLELLPDDGDALAYRARCLTQLGRLDDALRDYREAVALEPFFITAQIELGTLLIQLQRGDEAVDFLEDVLLSHLKPDAGRLQLHLLRGHAYVVRGETAKASEAWREGMRELRTGLVDWGTWTATRPPNALSAEQVARFQQAFRVAVASIRQ